jgi:hypothetical protein
MRTTAALALLLALLGACARQDGGPSAGGGRVESPDLGVAVARLPDGFRQVRSGAETIELEGTSSRGPGRVVIAAGPVEIGGINLVEAVRAQKAAFEALPGGSYLGNRELVTPIGAAFTARARYQAEGREVEETKVFAVHPAGDRLLIVSYVYPAGGDSQERVQQLLLLIGEIEGLPRPAA